MKNAPHNQESARKLTLLGSTGSIGKNCLDVVRQHRDLFSVRYLSAHQNADLLIKQAMEFRPHGVIITDPQFFENTRKELSGICRVYAGMEEMLAILEDPETDLVVNALVGGAGVMPTFTALRYGRDVALANKESLVVAGRLIMDLVKQKECLLLPIDSEHSAIWQCLQGEDRETVKRIILTASGGPFRDWPKEKLTEVTPEQALAHPNWNMGQKISIDSATLMNKGLEVIEAYWLYNLPVDQIDIVIHPQSIIHSLVEFRDGSLKAQLGHPDMRIPIQYALTFPGRLDLNIKNFSLEDIGELNFEKPEVNKFPCLKIAIEAIREGGTRTAVLNAANETAVRKFLNGEIKFTDIARLIDKTLQAHNPLQEYRLDEILEIHDWAQQYSHKISL
ncbi:MAG: 1-deoxy-D-xylulose-5-phosphate reductoisomerase [Calditrichaeota bacterium]|nr:1-deoxy-D-xylulose-5-phosphate reductoisomerase [Calditrichota bacterium]RQW02227.1 MAG: 1-deoxy-D-xylulose-5-phosphate reductoisomerase [Calditrichota bacterium]